MYYYQAYCFNYADAVCKYSVLNFNKLTSLTGYTVYNDSGAFISNAYGIKEIYIDNISECSMTHHCIVKYIYDLEKLCMRSLTKMNGYMISNCDKLHYLYTGVIIHYNSDYSNYYQFYGNNRSLIHIEMGDGSIQISISIKFNQWLPSYGFSTNSSSLVENPDLCSNNLEQFLYNFREYIVKRLATNSSKTYIYLHATTKSYILGTDESAYSSTWIVPGEDKTYLESLNEELANRNWGLA